MDIPGAVPPDSSQGPTSAETVNQRRSFDRQVCLLRRDPPAIHTGEPPRLYTDPSQFRYRDTSKIRGHIEAAYEASGRFLDELAR